MTQPCGATPSRFNRRSTPHTPPSPSGARSRPQAWVEARKASDFSKFAPFLQQWVDVRREAVSLCGGGVARQALALPSRCTARHQQSHP